MSEGKRCNDELAEDNAAGPTRSSDGSVMGPGGKIGPYKLLRIPGEGGYGIVYLAERWRPDACATGPHEYLCLTGAITFSDCPVLLSLGNGSHYRIDKIRDQSVVHYLFAQSSLVIIGFDAGEFF